MHWWLAVLICSMPAPVADWAFVEAQESFVVESVGMESAVRSLPQQSRTLLAGLGADDWRHREWAARELQRSRDVRACLLGQRLGDPEIRLRCRNVLRRLSGCPQCNGTGGRQETWGLATCGYCRGVGHFWPSDDWEDR